MSAWASQMAYNFVFALFPFALFVAAPGGWGCGSSHRGCIATPGMPRRPRPRRASPDLGCCGEHRTAKVRVRIARAGGGPRGGVGR